MDFPVLTQRFNSERLVHIVEPNIADCESLSLLLRLEGFQTIFSTSMVDALAQFDRRLPDVVVANSVLGSESAVVLLRNLKAFQRGTPLLAIQNTPCVEDTVELMRAGAVYVVAKPLDGERLLQAVRDELRKELAFDASGAYGKMVEIRNYGLKSLTPRETEILQRVANGMTNTEIGAELSISPRTVEVHRGHVMRKLHARNTPDLVRILLTS
jgi:two-component system response regulator FixJ